MTEQQRYKREVAYRVFSDELSSATEVEKGDEEYAVNYVRLPTGELVNRVFVVAALIDKEDVGTDSEYWKLIVSDPKGTFHAYIGDYQSIALAAIENIEVPTFVAMVCKLKTNIYNEKLFVNLAPESINVVDSETYDHWVAETETATAARYASSEVS